MAKKKVEKKTKISPKPRASYPRLPLEKVIAVPPSIQDKNGGRAMPRLALAEAMGIKPLSTQFRDLLSCSYKFGLTEGTEKADRISLTELGNRLTQPKSPELEVQAKVEALLMPPLFKEVLNAYKNKKYPDPNEKFFQNVLVADFSVPSELAKEVAHLIKNNGMYVGLVRNTSGSPYVRFDDIQPVTITEEDDAPEDSPNNATSFDLEDDDGSSQSVTSPQSHIEKPKPIFIAHGRNKGPLDQLKRILDDFKIPYKVAVDEPNSGKLIPEKIKALMRECGSAIFIFTGNEGKSFTNRKGQPEPERQVPNLNVVFELGAASILYNDRVIIFKEEGVEFASDFSSIGYISFESGNIQSKTGDLIRELVALGFIKITTAG